MTKMRLSGWPVGAICILFLLGHALRVAQSAEALGQKQAAKAPSAVGVGEGAQVTIGGFDIGTAEELPGVLEKLKQQLPRMKAAGVTSHETYVRWNLVEKTPGKFDFSLYDQIAKLDESFGIKWVPFLIIGPGYAIPDWFHSSEDSVKYVCLEHGEQSSVESLWNPHLRGRVSRFIKEFADHYKPMGVIESVLLGITGNYGEAIYPATSGED